jgi:hypothetical protein
MKYFSASFYYVRYPVLGKIILETYRRFSWKVWLVSIPFIFAYFLHQVIHLLFRLLDEVFHRNHKKQKITQPVFIIANPRSGTTYLHRLMALDEERFTYTKNAHTFFMTSSFVQFYYVFRWLDRKILSGFISATLNKLDDKIWGGWDDIHAMGFNKAEEDEMVFAQSLMSIGVMMPFPYFHYMHETKFLDHEPEDVRKNVMDFYESCVRRFVFRAGKNKTYLAKNVMSTGRFKSLMQRFPDAKIIYIARHPYDSVPSTASMFTVLNEVLSPELPGSHPANKSWGQLGIDLFKYSKEMRKSIPENQFFSLTYDDLLADPQGSVLKIYERFGWTPSEKFLERLGKEQARNKNYKSAHTYSLEQFGFTKQDIYAELGDIMDEFGFEKGF